jgi:phosphoglycolate phosphatase
MPLRYRAVLFDLDGTLVDSYAALTEAVNHALRHHGRAPIEQSSVRRLVGDGAETLLQRAFEANEAPAGVMAMFETRYDEVCCEQSRILDDVLATLESLRDLGVAMAVCTNKPTSFSAKILDHLDLSRFFAAIVGPDIAGAQKPDGAHVLRTLERTHRSPNEAMLVGDMPVDIRAARNSGIDVAVIATGSATAEELRRAEPDHFLQRFSDVIGIVNRAAA